MYAIAERVVQVARNSDASWERKGKSSYGSPIVEYVDASKKYKIEVYVGIGECVRARITSLQGPRAGSTKDIAKYARSDAEISEFLRYALREASIYQGRLSEGAFSVMYGLVSSEE